MNVAELQEKLNEFPPNSVVYLSSDAEGNRIDTLFDIEGCLMTADNDMKLKYLTETEIEMGYSFEDLGDFHRDIEAIVLFP